MSVDKFAVLQRLGAPTVTTAVAASAWKISVSAASKMLSSMATAGLVERLRHGLWLLDLSATPESLAGEITAPYPSYVSTISALYLHGVIDQVPSKVHVVSAMTPKVIQTSRGPFQVHRVPVRLYGGSVDMRGAQVATIEKALFDWAYISVVSGSPHARLPECEWPRTFRRIEVEHWLQRIDAQRIRTMTKALIKQRLG